MIEFTGQLDVALPPELVFERLADMAELDQWNPNVTTSAQHCDGSLTVPKWWLLGS